MLRVAVLGFGKVAETTHLPGFADERGRFSVVAVAEPSPERRARAKEVLPGARVYATPEELFARERVDVADVAAPPFLHVPLVITSLGAGAHVLCEKPLTLDLAEVATIERAAREADRVVYTVNNWRHAPLVAETIRRARSGALGDVRWFGWSVRRAQADPGVAAGPISWREDPTRALGGVLVDHGWHAFTVLHALFGDGPRRVRAWIREEPGKNDPSPCRLASSSDVEARVKIEQGDRRAYVRLTWRAKRRANRGRILGSAGSACLEDDRLVLSSRRSDRGETVRFDEALSRGSSHPGWFPPVLRAFADELEGRTPRGTSLAEARACAATIRAAYESARAGSRETSS